MTRHLARLAARYLSWMAHKEDRRLIRNNVNAMRKTFKLAGRI